MKQPSYDACPPIVAPKQDSRTKSLFKGIAIVLLVLSLFVGDAWVTYHSIVELKGKSFDYYFIWLGARQVGLGRDPYTQDIARQIMMAVSDDYAGRTEAQFYFVYPPFLALIVWPFVSFPFPESITAWLVSQQICLVLALVLMLRAMEWKPPPIVVAGLIAGWLAFRYSMVALLLGQTSFLVLFLLSAAVLASRHHHERTTALVLAVAMIKPQLVLLPLVGWVAVRLGERQPRAIVDYGVSAIALTMLPFMFFPDWISSFMRASSLYLVHHPSDSALSMLASIAPSISSLIYLIGAALLVGYVLWVAKSTKDMVPITSCGILASLVLLPLASVYDISLALLPWLACLYILKRRSDLVSRSLLVALSVMPVLSWLLVTLLPNMMEALGLPFDALTTDKLAIPIALFLIFVYTERKQMWKMTV